MSKSYKMKNDNYIDSTGIVHGRKLLSDLLGKLKFISINNICQTFQIEVDPTMAYTLGYLFDADGDIFEFHKPHNGNLTINRLVGTSTLSGVYDPQTKKITFTLSRTSIFFCIYT